MRKKQIMRMVPDRLTGEENHGIISVMYTGRELPWESDDASVF